MKIRDLTIGTRMALTFSILLVFLILLGGVSFSHAHRLWTYTEEIYEHPYQVSIATRDIKTNVFDMHRSMKDLVLATNPDEIKIALNSFRLLEIKVKKSFEIVFDSYLGPKEDVNTAYKLFLDWKTITDETQRMVLAGDKDFALKRIKIDGEGGAQVEKISLAIQNIMDFASKKAESFYKEAERGRDVLFYRLYILFFLIFLTTIVLAFSLIRSITLPLVDLTEVTQRYKAGNYDSRSEYLARNEIGTLSAAFNSMADTVQHDIKLKENSVMITKRMMDENELKPFCKSLLNDLLIKTDSQIAAIYILNNSTNVFEHFESIGLLKSNFKGFSAEYAEGQFGPAVTQKGISRISNIPDDSVFSLLTVAGSIKPKEIITIPILENNTVTALVSLANVNKYSDESLNLINEIWFMLTARFLGVLSFQRISDFSVKLDMQNRELEEKSNELELQADELKEYNIELELQKKQLDEANRLKSAFLSSMSHELRTPLNSVIALSGVLNRRLTGKIPDDEYTYLGIIEKNGKNLLALINDILDLSRIESGKEELTFSGVSLKEVIDEILQSMEPIYAGKGITVTSSVGQEIPVIISDQSKCHHIFQNLISNAVKFTEKGFVSVSAIRQNEIIRIEIKDSGIGISPEFMPFLFEEFRQADDKISRKFGGTGLGLAIVKKNCQLLDGRVEVVSTPGEGSVFTVILPIKPADISDSYEINSGKSGSLVELAEFGLESNPFTGKTILLVEDSEAQIIQLSDILSDVGVTIQLARNGKEALEAINTRIPDAMILDLQMPEVDGFEVLRQIRNLPETISIPVLILTAKHITKEELSFLKKNNIHQLIQKGSVNRLDLLKYIKNMLAPHFRSPDKKHESKTSVTYTRTDSKILIIEDNSDNLITIKALLDGNYKLHLADSGSGGLEIALNEEIDLILLDISLPEMDGFKVLDALKKNKKTAKIPVIALTARAMKGDKEDLLAYGFDDYIPKPIDSESFEIKVNDWLNLKK